MAASFWNDPLYKGTGIGYTADTAYTASQNDVMSSGMVNPWTVCKLYRGSNYTDAVCTLTNASSNYIYFPDFRQVYYDPPNNNTNINDSISSLRLIALPDCGQPKIDYLTQNPDVKNAGVDAWAHYKASGESEGRYWPGTRCDGTPNACEKVKADYFALYPDVAASGMDAWFHFANLGRFAGRAWPGIACDGSVVQRDPAPFALKMAIQGAASSLKKSAAMYIRSSLTSFSATVVLPAVALPFQWVINYNTVNGVLQTPHISISSGGVAQTLTVSGAPVGAAACKADLYVTFDNKANYILLGSLTAPATQSIAGLKISVANVGSTSVGVSYLPLPATTIPNSLVLYADNTNVGALDSSGMIVISNIKPATTFNLGLAEIVTPGVVAAVANDVSLAQPITI